MLEVMNRTMSPWNEFAGLHRDLDSLFGRLFDQGTARGTGFSTFLPGDEIRREGDKWIVAMAIPGIAPEDMDIEVAGRKLRVGVERNEHKDDAKTSSSGPYYGRIEREFTIPDDIDGAHVEATYRHGILELTLPLKESARPRRISVQVASDSKQLTA